jgi:tetratricopeptide (TPR) repeat protein
MRDPGEAGRAFEQARVLAPNSPSNWQKRAQCALQRGALEEAVDAANRALELGPDDPSITYVCIEANRRLSHLDKARALAWAQVSRFPNDWKAFKVLSSLYDDKYRQALEAAHEDRNARASELFDASHDAKPLPIERTSETIQRTSNNGLIHALYEKDPQATHKAAGYLRLTVLRLALASYLLGDYESAYREAQKAVAIAANNPNVWTLALVLADLVGDADAFAQLLRTAPRPPYPLEPIIASAYLVMLDRRSRAISPGN